MENGDERVRRGIPYNPHHSYKHSGWVSWPSFCGLSEADVAQRHIDSNRRWAQEKRAEAAGVSFEYAVFVGYDEAKAFMAEKGVASQTQWFAWCVENGDERVRRGIPRNPDRSYKHSGWVGWPSFCGLSEADVAQRHIDSNRRWAQEKRAEAAGVSFEYAVFVGYDEAKAFMAEKGVASQTQWFAWCVENGDERVRRGIPCNPDRSYKHSGWVSWPSFCGLSEADATLTASRGGSRRSEPRRRG